MFVTLTFNQQNCQHPELHTPAARRCFRPYHPFAATSRGDCSIHPRIDIGSKSCRRDFNSVQRALVLEDYAPPALRMQGFVSRKKGARSMGEEKKEGGKIIIIIIINKKLTGKINIKKKRKINITLT